MKLALPTCSNLPAWEVDDHALHDALRQSGHDVRRPVWDDPAVEWAEFDACVVRTTWDYPEKRSTFVAWADRIARQTKLFNSATVIRWGTHKRYLRDLRVLGMPVAPTVWLSPGQAVDVVTELRSRHWTQAILKPAIGATSRETLRFDISRDGIVAAQTHLQRMLRAEEMLLQPYYRSVERAGEVSVVMFDGKISHAVRKIPVPGDFRVQDDFGATDEPAEGTAEERALAARCVELAQCHLDAPLLYARVDFLRDDEGGLRINELEVVDPSLFFRHGPRAATMFAEAIRSRLGT